MSASSVLLTSSEPQLSDVSGQCFLTSSPQLVDVVPFEAALQRLLHAEVSTNEQLCSYSLQQAFRGLLYGVRAARLALTGTGTQSMSRELATSSTHSDTMHRSTLEKRASTTDACVLRGWQAALYRMALAATRSATNMNCVIFLSTQILCSPASAHGQGNERPCCKDEWTQALLHGLPLRDDLRVGGEGNELDERFTRLVQTSRRYQIGFLVLLSNTLRTVANGHVDGQRLCTEHAELFIGMAQELIPKVAQFVEESVREGAMHAAQHINADAATPPPSRLTVEFNNLIMQCGLWLTTDVLLAHTDTEVDAVMQSKGAAAKTQRQRKRPLVLDSDQPACLWRCVTVVRNALRRGLHWLSVELEQRGSRTAQGSATALLVAVSHQLNQVFSDLIKQRELLENGLLNATREFNTDTSNNVRHLKDMIRGQTLQMCFLVRNLTSVWVAVHGGLGLSTTSADAVLLANRDVLMHMASTLLRLPALEDTKESDGAVFMATDATLGACLALVAAAPTATLQAQLWATDSTVTQQIHGLLVQRAFRYHNERVLRLASLLSRAVLDAAVCEGALAGFAADSSDQLLELLESEDDAASRCVGELLCVSILEHPYRLIPALFRMLQHGSAATRRHVLELLSNLPDLVSEQRVADRETREDDSANRSAPGVLAPLSRGEARSVETRRRNVLRLLAENLFMQLQDEEVCVRLMSSSLFAKVHPEDVLLPLMNLCVQRDSTGRKQSAALSALTSVLTAHTDNMETYLLMLRCGYQCHTALRGKLSVSVETPGGTKRSAENLANQPSPTAVRRPTPQTPGDILTQALLYSADSARAEAPSSSSAPASMPAGVGEHDGTSADPHAGNQRRKEAQLQSALLTITDRWVRLAAPCWTYEGHALPLFQFIAHEANCGSFESPASGISDLGVPDEERVQWAMKYTLRLTATITGILDDSLSPSDLALLHTMHLRAIWDTFFGWSSRAVNVRCDMWSFALARAGDAASQNAGVSSSLHAVLLPLLCLRSCASAVFSVGSMKCLENEGERPEEDVNGDDGGDSDVVLRLWRVLWCALKNNANSSAALFSAYPDIQRVLLEVLCRFPPRLFFHAWTHWIEREETHAPNASTSLEQIMSTTRLLAYRVYLFGISSYLAAVSVQMPLRHGDSSATVTAEGELGNCGSTDLNFLLQCCARLEQLLHVTIPQWLMAEEEGVSFTATEGQQSVLAEAMSASSPERMICNSSNAQAVAMKQRLCAAAVDAGAVIGVVGLTRFDSLKTSASSPNFRSSDAEMLHVLCNSLLERPLSELTLAYRKHGSTKAETHQGHDAPVGEKDWMLRLTQFQVCVRIHECMLRAVSCHPVDAKGLLLSWFQRFLRTLMEVSNAACGSEIGRGSHGCRAAVDACSAIFHAVMLTHKLGNASTAASHKSTEGTSSTSPSLLLGLSWEDREAIVSFSLGCVRFTASAAVQIVGVRLLSGLLAAAPELFVRVEESGARVPASMLPVNLSASPFFQGAFSDAQCPLSAATSALRGIALLHADRPTRLLAEEVLRVLEKAVTEASG